MTRAPAFLDLLLSRLRGVQHETDTYVQPPHQPRAFAEAPGTAPLAKSRKPSSAAPTYGTDPGELPFASLGPKGHRARMRTRVLRHGCGTLADYELLEMLLYLAFKQGDTKPLAKSLINRFGSLARLLSAPTDTLLETQGLGPHAVVAIKLVQDAAHRLARAEVMDQPVLNNWDRLMDYLSTVLARESVEQFRILFLDPRNRLIADEAQSRGTVNHTPVYPREVVKRALELHATALILVHNHPSGDPTPSRADLEVTAEIAEAARVLGVVLHDHIIIGNGAWLSFRREGLLG